MNKDRARSVLLALGQANTKAISDLCEKLSKAGLDVVTTSDSDWTALGFDDWPVALRGFSDVLIICAVEGLSESHYLLAAVVAEMVESAPNVVVAAPSATARPDRQNLPYVLANATWLFGEPVDVALSALNSGGTNDQSGTAGPSPYRGLVAFSETDSRDFYGRERLAESLVADLSSAWGGGRVLRSRLLTLIGPSGVGKSSLAYAGVLPRIRVALEQSGQKANVVALKPGTDPLESLAIAILRPESPTVADITHLMQSMRGDQNALRLRERLRAPNDRLVLVVDQFEEIFTLCQDDDTRQAFVRTLLALITHPDGKTLVILTLRADFFGSCSYDPNLAHEISGSAVLVPGMARDDLRRAIEEPARVRGVSFEGGLVENLMAAIQQQASALPLLQFALEQMWREKTSTTITHELFTSVGGVAGALAKRADAEYERLSDSDKHLFRRILLRMVQPGEGTEDTRRRVARSELKFRDRRSDEVDEMCDFLSSPDLRLLSGAEIAGVATLEITHEALLTRWPRFREWIEDERSSLLHRKRLAIAAETWREESRDESLLLSGQSLTRTILWIEESNAALTLDEEEFVIASMSASVSSAIMGDDSGLADRMNECRATYGVLLDRAVELLANDANGTVARRAVVMSTSRDAAANATLVRALDDVGPEEFALVVTSLAETMSGPTANALAGTGTHPGIEGVSADRLLVAAALLHPADPLWQTQADAIIDYLLSVRPQHRSSWLETLSGITNAVEAAIVDRLARVGVESNLRDLQSLLLLVGPTTAGVAARAMVALVSVGDHEAAVKMFAAARDREIDQTDLGAALRNESAPQPLSRAAEIALLCLNGGYAEAAEHAKDSPPDILYLSACHVAALDLTRSEVATLVNTTATSGHKALALLAIAECQGELPAEVLGSVEEWYRTDPDPFVHSLAGLVISRTQGSAHRTSLDVELLSPAPHAECGWWAVRCGRDTLTLVLVQPAAVLMGSPESEIGRTRAETQWRASTTEPIWVGDRVCTISEYIEVCGPLQQDISEFSPTPAHPVVSQTWQEALSFAQSLELATPYAADLLTEVEWELSCRAGTTTAYFFGDEPEHLERYGWYLDNSPDRHTSLPRELLPNPLGIFDMHGGVYEWCRDHYGEYPTDTQPDYCGPETGPGRVLRGGGYNYPAADCRSAYRYFTQPENRNTRIGIRVCVRTKNG